jgi:hypothetical protein
MRPQGEVRPAVRLEFLAPAVVEAAEVDKRLGERALLANAPRLRPG